MSRRANSEEGSLDLLLDTICNTFGGVLFISMLVVVLINVTSSERTITPEEVQSRYDSAQRKLARTQQELEDIKEQIRQQRIVEKALYDPAISEDLEHLRDVQLATADLLIGRGQRQGTILSQAKEIGSLKEEMEKAKKLRLVTQDKLRAIESELRREIENRSQSAKLPRASRTTKTENILFLKSDKLCAYSTMHPNEFVATKQTVEPKPAAGTTVSKANESGLSARLSNDYSSTTDALTIFVWPDSFDSFPLLKDRLVSLGLDYSVQPIPGDEKIRIGNTNEQRDFMGK